MNIEQGMSNNEVQRINKFSGHPWGGSQPPSSPLCGDVMTEVTLREAVEIGNERSPYGLLWILSWVDSPVHNPPYHYTLVRSF